MRKTFFALILLAAMSLIISPAFNSPPSFSRIFTANTATASPGGEKTTSTPTPAIMRKVKLFPGIFVGVFHLTANEKWVGTTMPNNWDNESINWVYDGTVTINVSKAGSARADIVFSHADSNAQYSYQQWDNVIGLFCKHDSIYRGSVNIGPQSVTFDPQDGSFKIRGKLAGGMTTLGQFLDHFCKQDDSDFMPNAIDRIEGIGSWIAGDLVFNIDATNDDSVGSANQNNCSAALWEQAATGNNAISTFTQTCNWHVSRLPNKPGGWKK